MLPPDAVRTITIFCRWQNQAANLVKPMRRVLHNCSWEERSIATALQTGNILREPAVIRVFDETSGLKWIPPHIWNALPESELMGLWTCDLTLSAKPVIVPFKLDMETGFGTSGAITTWENNLVRDVAGATRVVECNDNEGRRDENGKLIYKKMAAHIRMRAG